MRKTQSAIADLLKVMARLRSRKGCPWDREQDHHSLRWHAVEEVYELLDAIEAGDDHEMVEELGDLLLQVVFHCQLARERGAFDFEKVARRVTDKLIRRHPHVFGNRKLKSAEAVLTQWERIKRAEKQGTSHERRSALDGIPRHLPALLRAEKLVKKARKAGLMNGPAGTHSTASLAVKSGQTAARRHQERLSKPGVAKQLFSLAEDAQARGWSAEELLLAEVTKNEQALRRFESRKVPRQKSEAH